MRSKSTTNYHVEALKETFRNIKTVYEGVQSKLTRIAQNKLPKFHGCYVVGTMWDCSKSPIGLCIYDETEDRIHDHCVFCGDPEEGK